jgi:hypothetical protein
MSSPPTRVPLAPGRHLTRTIVTRRHAARAIVMLWLSLALSGTVRAQTVTQRGFVEASGELFPQDAPNDPTNAVGDALIRDDVFVTLFDWLQLAGGAEARANSHDQVESSWRVDVRDRTARRPRLSLRRLTATIARGPLTLDIGKQFIRWGKTDIVTPTDRFAPRDFLNVVDNEFLPVTGVRAVVQRGPMAVEGVVVPWLTPSRIPLVDQRWTPVGDAPVPLEYHGAEIPHGAETGIRVSRTGTGFDMAVSYFNGFNHLPDVDAIPAFAAPGVVTSVDIVNRYPSLRMYGVDAALPTRWLTIKAETGYFTTSSPATDEYVLYVVQLERQTGEWLLIGGYAGQAITEARSTTTFAPDRGLARSFVGRASYTIDPRRDATIETAVRQNGRGLLVKGTFSQARGRHWRTTVSASLIRGKQDDFLGQYRRNSHAAIALRYSF